MTLSLKSKEALQSAQLVARSAAGDLSDESTLLLKLAVFPDDMLQAREYPDKLRYVVRRGAGRLSMAAAALEAFAVAAQRVLDGHAAPGYKAPTWPEIPAPVRRTGRYSLLPSEADHHISRLRHRVEHAARLSSAFRRIEAELGHVEMTSSMAHLREPVSEGRQLLASFESWLDEHIVHAQRTIKALKRWDQGDYLAKLPPLRSRKPRKPGVGGGAGAKTPGNGGTVRPGKWPGNGASKQQVACWLAASASAAGLPPTLPVVCALVESTLQNNPGGDADSVGLFQIRVGTHPAPAGFGSASGKLQSAAWWHAHPEAQMKWFAGEAKKVSPGGHPTSADAISNWAVKLERPAAQYEGRYRQHYAEAKKLVDKCGSSSTPGSTHAPAASTVNVGGLRQAITQIGVHEVGVNQGTKVNQYQAAGGTTGGQPWCAAFVVWCFKKAGFKWPPGNWAYCPNYLNEAKKPNGIFSRVASHNQARPGDLIVWFGHIGIVESVSGGVVKYVAGNQSDQVMRASIPASSTSYQILRPKAQ